MLFLYKYVRDSWTDFSAEGEGVRLNAWNKKLYAEGPVLNRSMLPNQLIESIFRYGAQSGYARSRATYLRKKIGHFRVETDFRHIPRL
jgi:hypothetical protein